MNMNAKLSAEKIDLTPAEARRITDGIKRSLNALPVLIHKAMTGKAYKALGYASVAEWSREEFGLSKARIYQLLSWQTSLIALRERFNLPEEWEMPEEKMRHLNPQRFKALLSRCDEAVKEVTEAEERAKLISASVTESFRIFLEEKQKAKATAEAKAEKNETPAAPHTATTPAPSPALTSIEPVEPNLELLLVKVKDTASVLATLPEKALDKDIALAQLAEVQGVIAELVRYYEAS